MKSSGFIFLTICLAATASPLAGETNTPSAGAITTAAATNAPPKEPTIVTSDRLQVDYANNVGTFTGNVLAIDPQITVRSDKMVVFFAKGTTNTTTRSAQKIIADGGVIITQEDKKSTSDHAVYTADDGKVVLTGNPRVQSPTGNVTGERITFWRGQDKMDVESGLTDTNRTKLIIYPAEEKKQEEPKEKP